MVSQGAEGGADDEAKREREARDLELARQLHAKDKAKLRRAKERSRLKKLEQQRLEMEQVMIDCCFKTP